MLIMVGITGVIFSLVDPARGSFRAQPEVSDMQQRLRVGSTFLNDDLVMAGAGAPAGGTLMGSLMNFFAPVQPYRSAGWLGPFCRRASIARCHLGHVHPAQFGANHAQRRDAADLV